MVNIRDAQYYRINIGIGDSGYSKYRHRPDMKNYIYISCRYEEYINLHVLRVC